MANLQLLYQQVILDHSKNPRFFEKNMDYPFVNACYNPLCGDEIEVSGRHHDGIIQELTFTGQGCAISVASASLMAEALQGAKIQDARNIFTWYQAMVTNQPEPPCPHMAGKLKVMAGVSQYPMRVKCATCAWHAFLGGLDKQTKCRDESHGESLGA